MRLAQSPSVTLTLLTLLLLRRKLTLLPLVVNDSHRVESDEFLLTQEFLSLMLGVRRASVSVVAAILQQAGFIHYHRGKITILNREGLESASCECYQAIKQESDRLLG